MAVRRWRGAFVGCCVAAVTIHGALTWLLLLARLRPGGARRGGTWAHTDRALREGARAATEAVISSAANVSASERHWQSLGGLRARDAVGRDVVDAYDLKQLLDGLDPARARVARDWDASPEAPRQDLPESSVCSVLADRSSNLTCVAETLLSWSRSAAGRGGPRCAIVTTWAARLDGVWEDIVPWAAYHARTGVEKIYVFYDGADPAAASALRSLQPLVDVLSARVVAPSRDGSVSRLSWDIDRLYGTGDDRWAERAHVGLERIAEGELREALDGIDWLIHIDPDELLSHRSPPDATLHSPPPNLPAYLAALPRSTSTVRFLNREGQAEHLVRGCDRLVNVSLFREAPDLTHAASRPLRSRAALGGAPTLHQLYTQGKSAARVTAAGIHSHGPHEFFSDEVSGSVFREVVSKEIVLLHYAYATVEDVRGRAARARRQCAGGVSRGCFVLETDYEAASADDRGEADRFWWTRMALTDMSYVRIPSAVEFRDAMLRAGLYVRDEGPARVVRDSVNTLLDVCGQGRG